MKFNSWSPKQMFSKSKTLSERPSDATGRQPNSVLRPNKDDALQARKTPELDTYRLEAVVQAAANSVRAQPHATREPLARLLRAASLPVELVDRIAEHVEPRDVTPTFFTTLNPSDKEKVLQHLAEQVGFGSKPREMAWQQYFSVLPKMKLSADSALFRDQVLLAVSAAGRDHKLVALRAKFTNQNLQQFSGDIEIMRMIALQNPGWTLSIASAEVKSNPLYGDMVVRSMPEQYFRLATSRPLSPEDFTKALSREADVFFIADTVRQMTMDKKGKTLFDHLSTMRPLLESNPRWLPMAGPDVWADTSTILAAAKFFSGPMQSSFPLHLLSQQQRADGGFMTKLIASVPIAGHNAAQALLDDPSFWQNIAQTTPGALAYLQHTTPQSHANFVAIYTQRPELAIYLVPPKPTYNGQFLHEPSPALRDVLLVPKAAQAALKQLVENQYVLEPIALAPALRAGVITRAEAIPPLGNLARLQNLFFSDPFAGLV